MTRPTSIPPEMTIYVDTCPHGPDCYATGDEGTCHCTACEAWARWGQRLLEREMVSAGECVDPVADEIVRGGELTLEETPDLPGAMG